MRSSANLDLHVVPGDGLPIYRQIMVQLSDAVAAGRLLPGDRLPSQRELAQRLVVAPLTVKKAYDLLEREGLVQSRHGSGTFVGEGARRDQVQAAEHLRQAARQLVTQARLSGLGDDQLIALVRDALALLERERSSETRTDDKESAR